MIRLYLFLIISLLLTSCVSIDSGKKYKEQFFKPSVKELNLKKVHNKYRVEIILNNYAKEINMIKDIDLIINGEHHKINFKESSNSQLVSFPFNPNNKYLDIIFNMSTVLGDNNIKYKRTLFVSNSNIIDDERPYLVKATTNINIDIENTSKTIKEIYNNSKALLIGINQFQDTDYSSLPNIKNDIYKLDTILTHNGFSIEPVLGKINRKTIIDKIYSFIDNSTKKDRLIIYLSSHGTSKHGKGYLVSSDCTKGQESSTCVPFSIFKDISDIAKKKKVKHLLVVVDTCYSGLGVVYKGEEKPKPINAVANKIGHHIITAGQSNQLAWMDSNSESGMSLFTKFLIKGLEGNADLTGGGNYQKDNIITLQELYNYVREEVVHSTGGNMIPFIGKIYGEGEIIFSTGNNR